MPPKPAAAPQPARLSITTPAKRPEPPVQAPPPPAPVALEVDLLEPGPESYDISALTDVKFEPAAMEPVAVHSHAPVKATDLLN